MAYSQKVRARCALRTGNHKTDVILVLGMMARGTWTETLEKDINNGHDEFKRRLDDALRCATRRLASERRARVLASRPDPVPEAEPAEPPEAEVDAAI